MGADERSVFALLLRQFRERAELTQEELAERAGLSADAIGLLERGERQRPQRLTVQRLAEALALPNDERARFEAAARRAAPPSAPAERPAFPVAATPFVGRTVEIADLLRRLVEPETRLVTLTGPGGVGKTRLALEVGARLAPHFADGAVFVPLASLRDPALVTAGIAQALALREQAGQGVAGRVVAALRARQTLLVLDNFEHLPAAAPYVADLLAACPRLALLVTSRTPLRLSGEQQFPVSPFPVPDTADLPSGTDWETTPALALFAQRARAVAPAFAITDANLGTVAAICRDLDGLPLAIELAAAWVKTLPPRALLTRLERRLRLLTSGARDLPERHRSLRDAIAWSDELLPRRERALFRRLAVFVGGWTLEGMEAICGPDVSEPGAALASLAALVDASLVLPPPDTDEPDREPRFGLLETVREYAAEQLLAAGEDETIRDRHVAYYLDLVERAQAALVGPEEGRWLARLEDEHPNLRAALRRAIDQGDAPAATRFAAVLWRFWAERGYLAEGRRWLEEILNLISGTGGATEPPISPLQRAMLLHVTGNLVRTQGDYAQARALYEECLAIRRAYHDTGGIAAALHNLGIIAFEQGAYALAVEYCEEALPLVRQAGNTYGVAFQLTTLGNATAALGATGRAINLFTEAQDLFRQLGHTWGIVRTLIGLGDAWRAGGDTARAATLYREGLTLSETIGDRQGMADELEGLAYLAIEAEDARRAVQFFGAATALRERIGAPRPAIQQASYEQALAVARNALGEEAFAAAREYSEGVSIEEVFTLAMGSEPVA